MSCMPVYINQLLKLDEKFVGLVQFGVAVCFNLGEELLLLLPSLFAGLRNSLITRQPDIMNVSQSSLLHLLYVCLQQNKRLSRT